jgi:hypothetical protein
LEISRILKVVLADKRTAKLDKRINGHDVEEGKVGG